MNDDRISRDDAERVLREAAGGPRPGQDDLTAFLAAAAGPARDDELAGEEAAVSAFRRARARRSARRRPLVARVLTVKVALALGLPAMAIGGVAVAAGTGTLPGPLGDQRPASVRTTVRPPTSHPVTERPPGNAGPPVPSPTATTPPGTPTPPGASKGPKDKKSKKDKKDKKDKGRDKGRDKKKQKPTPPGHNKTR